MKIVYIVQYYPPHIGGLEKVAKKQAESAVEAGHDVSVVTFALPNKLKGTEEVDIQKAIDYLILYKERNFDVKQDV